MAGKGKIHKHPKHNTNGFDKNPQNINRSGANRKSFRSFNDKCKKLGIEKLTQSDYVNTLLYLANCNEQEIQELAKDTSQPLQLRLIIAELTDPNTRGKTLQDLRDYAFHKGVTEHDIKTDGKPITEIKLNIVKPDTK